MVEVCGRPSGLDCPVNSGLGNASNPLTLELFGDNLSGVFTFLVTRHAAKFGLIDRPNGQLADRIEGLASRRLGVNLGLVVQVDASYHG